MSAIDGLGRRSARLLHVDAGGLMRGLPRAALASLFSAGDLVIANDAATLPASLAGVVSASGEPIEVRLAGWVTTKASLISLHNFHQMRDRRAIGPASLGDAGPVD